MPVLVANLDFAMVNVYGGFMSASGMFTDTAITPNPSLQEPLASAARMIGLAMLNPMVLVDADLVSLAVGDVQKMIDVAKLKTVEACLGTYTQFDTDINGGYSQKVDQLRKAMMSELTRLQAYVLALYGIGTLGAPVQVGQSPSDFPIPNTPTWGLGWDAGRPSWGPGWSGGDPPWGIGGNRTDH